MAQSAAFFLFLLLLLFAPSLIPLLFQYVCVCVIGPGILGDKATVKHMLSKTGEMAPGEILERK